LLWQQSFGAKCRQRSRAAAFRILGIVTVALTEESRKQLQPNETGILVQSVVDGGSAKDSGIQANDTITQVNDHKVIDVWCTGRRSARPERFLCDENISEGATSRANSAPVGIQQSYIFHLYLRALFSGLSGAVCWLLTG